MARAGRQILYESANNIVMDGFYLKVALVNQLKSQPLEVGYTRNNVDLYQASLVAVWPTVTGLGNLGCLTGQTNHSRLTVQPLGLITPLDIDVSLNFLATS